MRSVFRGLGVARRLELRTSVRGARIAASSSCLALALVSASASGAPPKRPRDPASSTQFTLRRGEAGGDDAIVARERARAGDCAGALPLFDAAIRKTVEPTLRRDRGLCHEKVGDVFPAIDDYRAYLVARPDAADADQIRQRLARLEEQAGVGGPSADAVRESETEQEYEAEAHGKVAVGTSTKPEPHANDKNEVLGPRSGEAERSYDYYRAQEKLADAAEDSPLRYGKGAIIGVMTTVPRYFFSQGNASDLAYAVGGTLRYSMGPTLSLVSEFAFAGIGTQGDNTAASGPLLFGGVELRFPLTKFASDQLIVGGGFGFERYTVSGTRVPGNMFLARFRGGFRHVFGPALGVEITADGGPGDYAIEGFGSNFVAVIGGAAALVVGF